MRVLLIPCPECGFELRIHDRSLLGRHGRCPQCRTKFPLEDSGRFEVLAEVPVAQPLVAAATVDSPASDDRTAIVPVDHPGNGRPASDVTRGTLPAEELSNEQLAAAEATIAGRSPAGDVCSGERLDETSIDNRETWEAKRSDCDAPAGELPGPHDRPESGFEVDRTHFLPDETAGDPPDAAPEDFAGVTAKPSEECCQSSQTKSSTILPPHEDACAETCLLTERPDGVLAPVGASAATHAWSGEQDADAQTLIVEQNGTLTFREGAARGAKVKQGTLPEVFGRYRILRELGHGSMGTVYLAFDTQLERQVALKVPKFAANDREEAHERFYREARAAAMLRHPNICPVHDIGEIDGVYYITMAYINGRPLSDFIRHDRPLNARKVAATVRKLALALQEAHDRGIIHRDLKPGNVMIDAKRDPLIMDFGLVRQINKHESARLTHSGVILGSPAYMSPEQIDPNVGEVSGRSDIYSLGVLLYELLTQQRPYQGYVGAVMGQILRGNPTPPAALRKDLDPRLEAICLKMMARRIEDRYQSMREVANALAAYLRTTASDQPHSTSSLQLPAIQLPASLSDAEISTSAASGASADLTLLDQKKAQACQLRKERQYAAAIAVLEELAHLKDAAAEGIARWARGELTRTKAEMRASERALRDACANARKLIAEHRYDKAESLLKRQPAEVRTPEANDLLDEARERAEELKFLVADINEAIKRKAFDGLLPSVERLLELKPNDRKGLRLLKELQQKTLGGKDRDRQAAEWVLRVGGSLKLRIDGRVVSGFSAVPDLPGKPFQVVTVGLFNNKLVSDTGLKNLEGLESLESLTLSRTSVSDDGLEHLQFCRNLASLHLGFTHVTDAGLVHLQSLTCLRELDLASTAITDAGLKLLCVLESLEFLGLYGTAVTDAAIAQLKSMRMVKLLELYGSQITPAGAAELRTLLPGCRVNA